ncbi:hypothetical protein BS47DRAFT_1343462 [Hydnum rufescens UP504]|uniref:Nop14-like protein n=1 Tax=Hydnum rufescens UP504 TaxID=1448309 RepID=A0A9P6DXR5_9AGAM|nr:hypothetical protein BS47DRAFT_1343462 [Hydnum rufescens UP504]
MAKGSQLTQLKSALSQAGLSRQSQPGGSGKKRKRTVAVRDSAAEKEKKVHKLDEINRKLNPFDVKVTKLKHDVGGRNVKGVVGRPALSKQAGLEQRKKLLLPEYERRGRAGGVIDRRFGENDSTLTPEERMLERFTKERQRASRGVEFNLEDDEDLTHYGQSLSALDDFDGTGLALEDPEDKGQIDSETVKQVHFGGFKDEDAEDEDEDGQPPRKKTKAEVMAEVMAKSKEYKYQRQLAKEQDDEVRGEMDREFNSFRDLLFGQKIDPSSSGSNAVPLGKRNTNGSASTLPSDPSNVDDENPSGSAPADDELDYDQTVRQLAFDKRAKPTDRTKTEEELAAEEAAKLEKAERARLRRMRGETDDLDDESDGRSRAKRRRADADDLDDDFDLDDGFGLGKGLGDADVDVDAELSSKESASDASASSDEGSESGDDDYESSDGLGASADEALVDGDVEELIALSSSKSRRKSTGSTGELPYTFPCPSTHSEFLDITDGIKPSDLPIVVQRIRTIYHPSLGEANKEKLMALCTVLIDHVLYASATRSSPVYDSLAPHIFSLSQTYPIHSAQYFISRLVLMHKNLARGLTRGATLPDSKTFPGTSELALLRLIGSIWSTSDQSHPVVTPAILLIGQYLSQARVRSLADLASGLFLCTLTLQYQSLSKRLVPEAINFLLNSLAHLAPHALTAEALPGSFSSPDFNALPKLDLDPKLTSGDGPDAEQHKVDLLAMTYGLLGKFATLYNSLDGFIELFQPCVDICGKIKVADLSKGLQKFHTDCADSITRMITFALKARKPLALQAHKPIPIASYVPKFDAGYSFQKRHDPDSQRNAGSKLKALYRKEHKGAMRELRKDNKFLAGEQARRQAEKDTAYKSRMAKVHGELQLERAEEKAMQREKAKNSRRAGKK